MDIKPSHRNALLVWLLGGFQRAVPRAELVRAAVGALLGIAMTGYVSTLCLGSSSGVLVLIAPMGASAVLLFGVPASPLAQPWSIIGGNLIAATIGVTAATYIHLPVAAAAVAVSLSLALMSLLRCVHPPSGAVALTAVLGGPQITVLGYRYILCPTGLNTILLVAAAVLFNNLTKRSYPHHAHRPAHPHPPLSPLRLTPEDFDAVLADYGDTIDISRDDLETLVNELIGRSQGDRSPGPRMRG